MVRENVIAQLANLKSHPSVRLALEQGRLALHGWVYDIESGSIERARRRHEPLRPARRPSPRLRNAGPA